MCNLRYLSTTVFQVSFLGIFVSLSLTVQRGGLFQVWRRGQSTLSIRARGYAITSAWVSRHRSASGRREEPRWWRAVRGIWESNEKRWRGRTDRCKWAVREMAPNRLVCRWTHYLSHADTTDTLARCTRLIALMASLRVRVSRAIRDRGRGRKLVM